MSYLLDIDVWWNPEVNEQFETFRRVLDCIPIPGKYIEIDGSGQVPKRFNRVHVFDRCFAEILDRKIESDSVEDVLALLKSYQRHDVCFVIGSGFNYLDYDQEKNEIYTSAG